MEERLDKIEMKLAYLEGFLKDLQDESLKTSAKADRMEAEMKAMKEKLLALAGDLEEIPNRRPPHY